MGLDRTRSRVCAALISKRQVDPLHGSSGEIPALGGNLSFVPSVGTNRERQLRTKHPRGTYVSFARHTGHPVFGTHTGRVALAPADPHSTWQAHLNSQVVNQELLDTKRHSPGRLVLSAEPPGSPGPICARARSLQNERRGSDSRQDVPNIDVPVHPRRLRGLLLCESRKPCVQRHSNLGQGLVPTFNRKCSFA